MSSDLGGFAGPLIAGLLVDAFSFSWAFAATAAICLAGTATAIAMPETLVRSGTTGLDTTSAEDLG
jgi:dipeptide/tripeptide permease